MDYELSIDMPNLAKGAEVQIAGLGTFENGSSYKITDEEHDSFRRYHGSIQTVTSEANEILGSELALGPTLIQASENMYGVSVKQDKPETEAQKKKREEKEAAEAAQAEQDAAAEAQAKAEEEAAAIAAAKAQEGEGS
jgi:hypothetical protein